MVITVIYTIYPPETVLQVQEEQKRHYLSINLDGRTFVLEFKNGEAEIVRLISANPSDYLNPKWQPGSKISFTLPGAPNCR